MIKRAVNLIENGVLESAKRTLGTERRAMESLERAFDADLAGPFLQAVELIGELSGRVIVTGVGKSGHIGVKIAATLASTGTPAFFMHAAEANHGDLGMVGRGDAVLALSKGGESVELATSSPIPAASPFR
jgi:arabinose-5-phosphate isomerase